MTKNEAQAILNKVREGTGSSFSVGLISAALNVTGDLRVAEAVRGEVLDSAIQPEAQGERCSTCPRMVERDMQQHRAYSWARGFSRSQEANE